MSCPNFLWRVEGPSEEDFRGAKEEEMQREVLQVVQAEIHSASLDATL